MALSVVLAANPTSPEAGVQFAVNATPSGAADGATYSYAWKVNNATVSGTGSGITYTSPTASSVKFDVTVTATVTGDTPSTETASGTLTVVVTAHDYGVVDYYHILPQRDSVYYWLGWWVGDEIDKAVADGVDWSEPEAAGLKYAQQLRTVAKLINTFDNVEIQESRNGRIVGIDDIKNGKIYVTK